MTSGLWRSPEDHMWIPDTETRSSRAVVAHAFNPSTLGGRGRQISEFKASLVYRVSSKTARATQKNPVLINKNNNNNQTNKQTKPDLLLF